ncbi:PD-(D/E)XK nuclease domain-containing protein [Actinokineospora sp. NPDC004072]
MRHPLKQERIAIETKMTRNDLGREKLRKELNLDIEHFRAHPHVSALFALVYDPKRKITNARGFENDLNADSDGFLVRVVITR